MNGKLLLSVIVSTASCMAIAENHTLYVDNQTGHEVINIYAWADAQPELFGGWPGAVSNGKQNIEGVEYLTYALPESDVAYNFIINWDGGQYDGPTVVCNEDVFLRADAESATVISDPRSQTYNIYVKDNSGWDNLYLYAWGEGLPELFGGWPGAAPASEETINGEVYKVFPYTAKDASYNLIFNNNDGTQFDGPYISLDKNYTFIITGSGYTSGVSAVEAEDNDVPTYYTTTGIRVNRPAKGVYIVVRGDKTSKVTF